MHFESDPSMSSMKLIPKNLQNLRNMRKKLDKGEEAMFHQTWWRWLIVKNL